jgi:hypothetical protein
MTENMVKEMDRRREVRETKSLRDSRRFAGKPTSGWDLHWLQPPWPETLFHRISIQNRVGERDCKVLIVWEFLE